MNQRRQTVVDARLQLHYFWLWILVALGIVTVISIFALSRWTDGLIKDPTVADTLQKVLWITGAYIMVLSMIFGSYAIFHLHRVAGPVYRLNRCVNALLSGELGEPVTLRKKDYFHELAENLDVLRNQMLADRQAVERIKEKLAASDHVEAAKLVEKLLAGMGPRPR